MDEVDNIIIHSLRQIGCKLDGEVASLVDFTPELLVHCTAKCLHLIQPDLEVPESLPPGIAQRYNVTTALAEACASVGFRGDIGYQSFLYSNVTEVRRVFMFLIERLPKEADKEHLDEIHTDRKSLLDHNLRQSIKIQLNAAWTPQYCKQFGARKFGNLIAIQASNNGFLPQRLNVPHGTTTTKCQSNELNEYWSKRSPTIFQQTNSSNICASLIHKNDQDLLSGGTVITTNLSNENQTSVPALQRNFRKLIQIQKSIVAPSSYVKKDNLRNVTSVQQLALNNVEIPNENDIVVMPEIRESDAIRFEIEKVKGEIKNLLQHRQDLQSQMAECKTGMKTLADQLPQLQSEKKLKERTHLLLENPDENIEKMTKVLATAHERINKLNDQWDEHRIPLQQQIEVARGSSNSKYSHTKQLLDEIKSTKEEVEELADKLKQKATLHAKLVDEFEKNNRNLNRNSYTSRILEIIGNIRKQKASIDKVLNDTRDIQKEINTINGQLDRQFTVTDDLLFKTAKKDEPSKKAYKLLATLHSNCGDLIQMVNETGQVEREIRDLEDQIENERDRNIPDNLKRITNDLKLLEIEAKELQEKINVLKMQPS
ncbi:coiled-coil domain-containing protein 22 homolog [Sitodiplosis mosellana]|uniref:coiled-coil domain-containing protein 22 homolog n=1 Tax=Sitodiplosis mosellana TaxID=263140 RepID=UPI0024451ACD|nr:coiled-coil domain-containing protein 22 homolog [Sitodiplosis mosellana]XP_055318730.1 coiled-coil domain-containing protein 22 homolog [Sitodiplosis mosellana]XP_055318731.1 coiled-coil domain-containing protein 22 homolog [Sitodiplosis mosellana]XP_055318732.1 coiled-coil domain-containing protein 22 homolog [Sitodiplosis mosellana]XP_055318735.1 coiled-coil domain-containing protein 22 homolog [Sitodiplosis mosellana]XP_055318736.1 coiled-coil domain-containing protein 22 homolog [Sitod